MTRSRIPPYVHKKVAKGRTYYRFERGGVSCPIDPFAPDFLTRYAKLMEGQIPRVPRARTMANLIADYRAGDDFPKLAVRTKKDYERVLSRITEKMGDKDPGSIRKVYVVEWQRQLSGRFASYFVQVLSILMSHACSIGWRDDNPCIGVKLKQTVAKAEHVVWTDAAIAKFRAEASPLCRLIFEVGLQSVQRPSDWTRFNWEDYDGESINLVQSKTGRKLRVFFTEEARAFLDSRRPKVMNLNGKTPMLSIGRQRLTYDKMAHLMLAERRRLGVEKHDLHALRYRGVMELAFKGCDDDQIASISGHMSKRMIEKYAGEARQIMLSKAAAAKRGA